MSRNSNTRFKDSARYCFVMAGVFLIIGIVFVALVYYLDTHTPTLSTGSIAQKAAASMRETTNTFLFWISVIYGLTVVFLLVMGFHWRRKDRLAREKENQVWGRLRGLTAGGVSADDFLSTCDTLRMSDFTGVYVLHNKSKDMYYVGQSVKVVSRVLQHLTGHGNGDVYADFKYGDEFEVSTVSLVDSGYGNLNDLERDTIAAYDAYNNGYNKTAGNSR